MTRWVSNANATAAAKVDVHLAVLCDLDFDDQTVRVNDSGADLVYAGNTYKGLGEFGTLDNIDETIETIARPLELTLSGVPGGQGLLTEAMTQNYQGRTLTLYLGILDPVTMQWAANPEIAWEGRMDYMTVELGPNTSSIRLRCENRLNREPPVSRMNDVDQQLAHSGDTFFNLLWMIPLSTAGWGGVTVQYPANVPPVRHPYAATSPFGNVGGINLRGRP